MGQSYVENILLLRGNYTRYKPYYKITFLFKLNTLVGLSMACTEKTVNVFMSLNRVQTLVFVAFMCLLVAKRLRKELPNLTDCSNDSTSHTVKFFVLILAKLIRNIPWTEPVCNMEVSKKMAPERTLILRIKKTAYIPLTHNGGSKNLSRTVHIEGKRDRGSERVTWGACVNT